MMVAGLGLFAAAEVFVVAPEAAADGKFGLALVDVAFGLYFAGWAIVHHRRKGKRS